MHKHLPRPLTMRMVFRCWRREYEDKTEDSTSGCEDDRVD